MNAKTVMLNDGTTIMVDGLPTKTKIEEMAKKVEQLLRDSVATNRISNLRE